MRGQPDRPPPEAAKASDAAPTPDNAPTPDSARMPEARVWRLPPGHPSSPYDGNGDLRSPVPDPRDRELALPDEKERRRLAPVAEKPLRSADDPLFPNEGSTWPGSADRKDAPDRDSTRAWREAVPHLQELWRKHEEKWPDARRPPADRSQDEPGSWRSDSGYPLNERDNRAVESEYQKVAQNEKRITELMGDVELASAGRLVGKEFRLKGEQRFKEKVAAARDGAPNADIGRILSNVHDVVRYTLEYDEKKYAAGVKGDVNSMRDAGLELVRIKNSWEATDYKGINSQWRDNDTGQVFEVQYHTRISFEAKQMTHKAYERLRAIPAQDPANHSQIRHLHAYQQEVSAHIMIPEGATLIPDYP